MSPLVLASSSPRRLALLAQIGITPDRVFHPEIDETPGKDELPRAHVQRVAMEKLSRAREDFPDSIILVADTVAACGRRILSKAENPKEALHCLRLLSGRRHRVLTCFALYGPEPERIICKTVETVVQFKHLTEREIDHYVAGGEWSHRAGAYSIQGRAGRFIKSIRGSYPNVMGLPLYEVAQSLISLGYHWDDA